MPTKPLLLIMKEVPVVEPTTNCGAAPSVAVGLIERRPQGEVVPTPTRPDDVIVILVLVVVAVPPVRKNMLLVALLFAMNMSLPAPRNSTSPAPPTLNVCRLKNPELLIPIQAKLVVSVPLSAVAENPDCAPSPVEVF